MRTNTLFTDSLLPLLVQPAEQPGESSVSALCGWIKDNEGSLSESLLKHGGVLFRGFELSGPRDMHQAVNSFEPALQNYVEGQSRRHIVFDKIYTSTEYPAHLDITLHNELSYVAKPPRRIFFFCQTPPNEGGETPLVDCRRLLKNLDPSIVEEFTTRGILYVKHMSGSDGPWGGKSWQAHFETEDKTAVESYLRAAGVEHDWLSDGVLRTHQARPAVTKHPETAAEIWFNQATLWHVSDLGAGAAAMRQRYGERLPIHALFGDGGAIPDEALDPIRTTAWESSVAFPWEKGDFLILDNHLVAHGRRAFSGDRHILVAMA